MITRVPTDWTELQKDDPDQVQMFTATVACPICGYTCTITENATEVADRNVCQHFDSILAGDFVFHSFCRPSRPGIFVPGDDDVIFVLADGEGGDIEWFSTVAEAIEHIKVCFDTTEDFEIYEMSFGDFMAWKDGSRDFDEPEEPVWVG